MGQFHFFQAAPPVIVIAERYLLDILFLLASDKEIGFVVPFPNHSASDASDNRFQFLSEGISKFYPSWPYAHQSS